MICPTCGKETILVKENKKLYYALLGVIYWMYVMQKDAHHCIHCGTKI